MNKVLKYGITLWVFLAVVSFFAGLFVLVSSFNEKDKEKSKKKLIIGISLLGFTVSTFLIFQLIKISKS